MSNKNSYGREFLRFCRIMEIRAKAEVKRHEEATKAFDSACVKLMREEIRLVVNNKRSAINWRIYT